MAKRHHSQGGVSMLPVRPGARIHAGELVVQDIHGYAAHYTADMRSQPDGVALRTVANIRGRGRAPRVPVLRRGTIRLPDGLDVTPAGFKGGQGHSGQDVEDAATGALILILMFLALIFAGAVIHLVRTLL